jgi:molybdopterin-guanine dinucleotide biosynthesis protein A
MGALPVSYRRKYAGYVLVGGNSSRMGRDKAFLAYRDTVLADFIARQMQAAAGKVTLVGPVARYLELGWPVIPDLRPDNGPLGGIEAALSNTTAEWNLVAACDMPRVSSECFQEILSRADQSAADCLVPLTPEGQPEPLSAAWRASCLKAVSRALDAGRRKTQDLFAEVRTEYWKPLKIHHFENVNTPEDWLRR